MPQLSAKILDSTDLGTTEVFHFAEGLYGFPEEKEFALSHEKKDSPFLRLQSVQNAELAFAAIDPNLFLKDSYEPEAAPADLDALNVKSVGECKVYAIVTIPASRPKEMTANLQGPLLLNSEKKTGRQIISLNNAHEVQFPILRQLEG